MFAEVRKLTRVLDRIAHGRAASVMGGLGCLRGGLPFISQRAPNTAVRGMRDPYVAR